MRADTEPLQVGATYSAQVTVKEHRFSDDQGWGASFSPAEFLSNVAQVVGKP